MTQSPDVSLEDKSQPRLCQNCQTRLMGEYCSACGQKDTDYHTSIWRLAGELLGETFEADGRLLKTIFPLFFRPGFLVAEFLRGKRASYSSPVRLYIFAALVSFFVLGLVSKSGLDEVADRLGFNDGGIFVHLGDDDTSPGVRSEGGAPSGVASAAGTSGVAGDGGAPPGVASAAGTSSGVAGDGGAPSGVASAAGTSSGVAGDDTSHAGVQPDRSPNDGLPDVSARANDETSMTGGTDLSSKKNGGDGTAGPGWPVTKGAFLAVGGPEAGSQPQVGGVAEGTEEETGLEKTVREKAKILEKMGPAAAAKMVVAKIFEDAPTTLSIMVPIFALLLKFLYFRRYYFDHLIFSLNIHALALLLVTIAVVVKGWIGASAFILVQVHVFFGMKRLYQQSWVRTLLKYVVLAMSYSFLMVIAFFATLVVAVVSV